MNQEYQGLPSKVIFSLICGWILVARLVKAEVEESGIPLERIIVAGFSQGGSVALYTSLAVPSLSGLGGVFILSSWLPLGQQLAQDHSVRRPVSYFCLMISVGIHNLAEAHLTD